MKIETTRENILKRLEILKSLFWQSDWVSRKILLIIWHAFKRYKLQIEERSGFPLKTKLIKFKPIFINLDFEQLRNNNRAAREYQEDYKLF